MRKGKRKEIFHLRAYKHIDCCGNLRRIERNQRQFQQNSTQEVLTLAGIVSRLEA
jgi:hypothetical protein